MTQTVSADIQEALSLMALTTPLRCQPFVFALQRAGTIDPTSHRHRPPSRPCYSATTLHSGKPEVTAVRGRHVEDASIAHWREATLGRDTPRPAPSVPKFTVTGWSVTTGSQIPTF
ncbi:hypothetical protein LSAT2_015866 [Lamellibrachia satsuma]|nr:hypothetical protein LSAT2_015866 [Lamellibrachia satsuma]